MGVIGVSGAFLNSWKFGTHKDTDNNDENEFRVDCLAGCCQVFRRDLYNLGIEMDKKYGKFWCEDTDFCLQVLQIGKINYRIPQKNYLEHEWGGSGTHFKGLFEQNWKYLVNKWQNKKIRFIKTFL
jgi:GT2 family glycosyltransferase